MDTPIELQAGTDFYDYGIWGDYTYTSLDPSDSFTIWTVQQYAETRTTDPYDEYNWGTVIGAVTPF